MCEWANVCVCVRGCVVSVCVCVLCMEIKMSETCCFVCNSSQLLLLQLSSLYILLCLLKEDVV